MATAPHSRHVPVVRVIARLNVGGPALHAINLSLGMTGPYRTLLVTGAVGEGEADLAPRARERGVDLELIPQLGRSIRPWDDLFVFVKLVRLLRRVRPRIVHTHTAKAGTLGRLAAVVAGVPVRVHTFHGHVFHGYFGPLKTHVFVLIERALARLSTRIVAISPQQADELVDRYRICDRSKLTVIPLGLELDSFLPGRSAALREELRAEVGAGDRPVISCVGRMVPIKNHDMFLDVAARLTAAGYDYLYLLVGGGEEEPRIRRRVSDLGLTDRVVFLGWRSDLDRIYAGSDVVALTSLNEGTPVALIEALSAGRPVVATDVGGVRDVLEGGELGGLVPSGDSAAFAACIVKILSDPGYRRNLEARGPAVVPARYGISRLVSDLGGLYDQLLAAPGVRSSLITSFDIGN